MLAALLREREAVVPSPLPPGYARRRPEQTDLYRLLSGRLPAFLDRAADADGLPMFIRRTLESYLGCGRLERGFARVCCPGCRDDLLVALSCKLRGICPSCGGRTMADTAAHLVDRVLPPVAVRQWVLTLPWHLRRRLAYDAELTTAVLALFIRTIERFYAHCGAARHGVRGGRTGSVTAIQRFGSALNLNPHLHALFLDGVYVRRSPIGPLRFVRLRTLTDADVAEVLGQLVTDLHRLLIRRGLSDLAEQSSPDDGALALQQLALGSIAGQSPLGPSPSRHGLTSDSATIPAPGPRLCASLAGATLHAATTATRRGDLEVLCRYVLRPPLGIDRVRWREDGLVELSLPRPWSDGTTSLRFEPLTFIGRLVPLIPPPRRHQVRYHGVLAPNASWRKEITRQAAPAGGVRRSAPCRPIRTSGQPLTPRPRRLAWAELLKRSFAVDVLRCARCGSRRELLAVVMKADAVAAILTHLGLDTDDAGPRPPPSQLDLI